MKYLSETLFGNVKKVGDVVKFADMEDGVR